MHVVRESVWFITLSLCVFFCVISCFLNDFIVVVVVVVRCHVCVVLFIFWTPNMMQPSDFVRASIWFICLINLCCFVWFFFIFGMILWLLWTTITSFKNNKESHKITQRDQANEPNRRTDKIIRLHPVHNKKNGQNTTILTQQATTKQQRTVVPNAFVRASILNHFVLFCLILCFLNDFMVAVVVFVYR